MLALLPAAAASAQAARASALLAKYGNQLDRGGIVFFYILNLATTVSLAEALPAFLGTTDTSSSA